MKLEWIIASYTEGWDVKVGYRRSRAYWLEESSVIQGVYCGIL